MLTKVCRASCRPNRIESGGSPSPKCPVPYRRWRERPIVDDAEHESVIVPSVCAVFGEEVAERRNDRHHPPAGAALGLDRADALVPTALDSQLAARQRHVRPAKGGELASAQAGI